MAKVKSLLLRKSSGKLAGTTMYTTSGVTIMREIATDVKNPRTKAQMTQRVKLANLVNTYQVLKRFFKYAFENKKPLTSDYNAFVAANLTNSPVYLTKQAAAQNVVVPAPYRISEGTLGIRSNSRKVGNLCVSLSADSLSSITDATTIKQFSRALITANPGLYTGMQISFVCITSDAASSEVNLMLYEIVLDENNEDETVHSYIPGLQIDNGYIGMDVYGIQDIAAATFVLSSTVSGKTRVSTETLVANGVEDSIFVGSAALEMAINSYGESTDVFLDSNKANEA